MLGVSSNESAFTLEVLKTGLMAGKKHFLFFEQYSGEIDYNQQRVESSQVRFAVDARSVTSKDEWLKPQNRKKVVEHPQLTFTSTRIASKSGQYEVAGNLTVRGLAKPTTLFAAVKPVGDLRLEIDGNAEIRLKDYGLKPPSALLGLIGTKDRMTLRFLVWAERKV